MSESLDPIPVVGRDIARRLNAGERPQGLPEFSDEMIDQILGTTRGRWDGAENEEEPPNVIDDED